MLSNRISTSVVILASIAFISMGALATNKLTKPAKKLFIEQVVDLPSKNFNVKVRSVAWPIGFKSAEHVHAGPGPRYVLSGKVEITENGSSTQYAAGEVFWHVGGIPHTAENVDSNVETEVLIIELLPLK